MRSELVVRNVAALAASPPVRRQEMYALSVEQLSMLFTALDGERLRLLFVTAATLGLRRGELIALRWADVDLDARTLTVRRTGSRIAGQHVEGQPKSARSCRTISLPASLVAQLRRQSSAVAEEKLRLGAAWMDEGRVFPGREAGRSARRRSPRRPMPHSTERDYLTYGFTISGTAPPLCC
jgi:integrase